MSTPSVGKRALNRERMEVDILRLGRRQLADVGAAALSLRAIARDLGVASSAVYRYVESRDELLTRLIVESYDSLGDAVEAAEVAVARSDLPGRWAAIGHGLRDWAIGHPHDWALLFGSPVPGYAAPSDRTTAAGTRVPRLAMAVLADAVAARKVLAPSRRLQPAESALVSARAILEGEGLTEEVLPPDVLLAGLTAWSLIVGAINSEVFGYLGDLPGDARARFDFAQATALRSLLRPSVQR